MKKPRDPKQYSFVNSEGKEICLPGSMTIEEIARLKMDGKIVDFGIQRKGEPATVEKYVHRTKEQP